MSYNFGCRDKNLTIDDFQSNLLSFENLVEAQIHVQPSNFAFAARSVGLQHQKKSKPKEASQKYHQRASSSHPHAHSHPADHQPQLNGKKSVC